jgi:Flp pilus assembly protein TadG
MSTSGAAAHAGHLSVPGHGRARTSGRRATGAAGPGQAGSATLELVVLIPVLLLVVTVVVQAGLWFHARSLALVAAQEGVSVARTYRADTSAGPARAAQFLAEHAGDQLTAVTITGAADATMVRVDVTGRSLSLVPGLPGPLVHQSAQGPIERFTTAGAP